MSPMAAPLQPSYSDVYLSIHAYVSLSYNVMGSEMIYSSISVSLLL
jgi:hypothetical protein